MKIYLDFDGTVVEHRYPVIGQYNSGCIEVIHKLNKAGHEIILNTMRVEFDNGTLKDAVEYMNQVITNLEKNTQTYSFEILIINMILQFGIGISILNLGVFLLMMYVKAFH